MAFAQNQDVVQEFTPDTAQEAFTDRIRFGRIGWRVQQSDPGSFHCMVEQRTILAIVVANQETRPFARKNRS